MECSKLRYTNFIPKWNTLKIHPSNVDSLKICDNGWFSVLTFCWTPAIIRIKIWHATHISGFSAHMFPGGNNYTSQCSELMVLDGDVKVKYCLNLSFVTKYLHICHKVININLFIHQSIHSCTCAC